MRRSLARELEDLDVACRALFDRDSGHSHRPPLRRVLLVEGPWPEGAEPASREALTRAQAAFDAANIAVTAASLPGQFADAHATLEIILMRDIAINHGADRDRADEREACPSGCSSSRHRDATRG